MLESIQSISDYLKVYGSTLADRIKKQAEPLFHPGELWDERINTLLREPYQAQGDTIMGIVQTLRQADAALIVGEMGSGKTLIGASVPYIFRNHGAAARTLVMCPGHLVKKWQREVLQTIPGARTTILRNLKDVMELNSKKPDVPEYFIVSKDRAKLGYAWTPAVVHRKREEGLSCPDCGQTILDKDGNPVSMSYVARNKRFCPSCGSPLWQADRTRIRRFAIAEYIKKYLKGSFDFFIADEVHQLKGGSTAQGNSFGALAAASKKTLALTGTLLGGYADDIFYILYRLSPESMLKENIAYSHLSRWMARYGVLERVTRTYPQDNIYSRGKKGSTTQKRKPGVSPLVFSNHLLGKCAFLHLEDIALDLPPISEEVIQVRMDGLLEAAYLSLEQDLLKAVREALTRGSKALLSTYLNSLLSYPDRPFNNDVIYQVSPKGEEIVAVPEELPQDILYAKEQQLLELIKDELQSRRKVFVYCQYTQTKDITARIKTLLVSEGVKAEVLKSTVSPEGREDWLKSQCKAGTQVIIANPRLVETGLDLYDFPTLVFYQTGYSIFTLRQASRRSWRIGQKKPVKIYYMFYQQTMQERAMQLMGSKLEASLAIEGKFSDEGLLAMTSGEDLTTAMAKALVEGLDVEGAEHIWKKINEANLRQTRFKEISDFQEICIQERPVSPIAKAKEEDEDRVVFIDLVSFMGKRKKQKVEKVAVKASEVDQVLEEREVDSVQFSLF